MNSNEFKMAGFIGRALLGLGFLSEGTSGLTALISDHSSNPGYAQAIECGEAMKRAGTFRGEKLGVVNSSTPNSISLGSLRRGQIVLYKNENDGTVSVKCPHGLERIAEEEARGRKSFSHSIVNVPNYFIQELVP